MNNNEPTLEQIAATEKAITVIDSCETCDHFTNAEQYLDLFLKQFNDQVAYDELLVRFKAKKLEVNCFE